MLTYYIAILRLNHKTPIKPTKPLFKPSDNRLQSFSWPVMRYVCAIYPKTAIFALIA